MVLLISVAEEAEEVPLLVGQVLIWMAVLVVKVLLLLDTGINN